jgi:hypothetical protein
MCRLAFGRHKGATTSVLVTSYVADQLEATSSPPTSLHTAKEDKTFVHTQMDWTSTPASVAAGFT